MNAAVSSIIRTFAATLFFAAILFIAAGSFDHAPSWWYLCTTLLTTLFNVLSLRGNEALMKERSAPGDGTKEWDKKILGISFLMSIAALVVGGLDGGRFHWSPSMPVWSCTAGAVLMIAGNGLFLKARSQNSFFSSVARIQHDRGQRVTADGLYAVVRHPGYLGMFISYLGLPLILASYWSIVPISVSVLLLFVRTAKEDAMLAEELAGYSEYQKRTTARLVPKIW